MDSDKNPYELSASDSQTRLILIRRLLCLDYLHIPRVLSVSNNRKFGDYRLISHTEESYRHYYRERCHGDMRHLIDPDSYEHPRVQWLLSKCHGSVLDVGCGTADTTAYLVSVGYDAKGVEPSREHLRIATERHPHLTIFPGFVEDLKDVHFDTVICGDVIEHVPDDAAFVQTLASLGDRVYITTPFGFWDSPEHLRDYDLEMARALVEPYGGSVELIADRNGTARWIGFSIGSSHA